MTIRFTGRCVITDSDLAGPLSSNMAAAVDAQRGFMQRRMENEMIVALMIGRRLPPVDWPQPPLDPIPWNQP